MPIPSSKNLMRYISLLIGLMLLGSSTMLGQGSGTISGVVTDSTGAIVPNAPVVITNQGTGVNYKAETNSTGVYQVGSLLPGNYTVQIQTKGFRSYVNKDLVLTTNQTLRVDVMLEVGQETQMITVDAAGPLGK